ncbi:hephaestin isoform X1 [Apus apus]|uniref:hephaestin isoform X1 n=1 Tax=Apus apus TaxID=8895 RepID=UPI0021F8AAB8|nr:hephaestin isoform X1 [Apus apus]XP_051485938.1 hephaestin isoform X1 [Apus apus]XP_051485939.1 hephaestin isoform X1 [Apus apus]XP_051485940.1 hephaestin isoform X1 [Apus apus]XP_051485941.1 hephaestin isoform X1 [Apus apus]
MMGLFWWLLLLYIHVLSPTFAGGVTRVYYLGIHEVDWNYAPMGKNVLANQSIEQNLKASAFLQPGKDRVGSIYKKSIYKQYTDSTYTTEIPKPGWLGFLGPVIRAEVGDTIKVHLKNFASRPYTIHPHGVFYEKDSEGSLYPDMSPQDQKKDDAVFPGGNYTYTWTVPEDHSPTADDPNCLTWIYHSHIDAPKDIASGLIGPLLTCKKGMLTGNSQRRQDVDVDFFLMFSVVDENLSWYLDQNIASFCMDPGSVDKEDEEFQESNKMHAINGYVFGNLPEVTMCAGDHVSWHLFGMGNEIDVHTAYFHGETLNIRGHRTDVASLFPATFITADMIPRNPGRWLLSCQINDHIQAGMAALYEVRPCSRQAPAPTLEGRLRKYYIAAKEVQWDYGPSGIDQNSGKELHEAGSPAEQFFKRSRYRIGGVYWKAKYVEYTDESFREEKQRSEEEKHLGILGPVIKAEVGDTILVTFVNKASWPFSIQPHGVSYGKAWEGMWYHDGVSQNGVSVAPLHNVTYRWAVPEHVGPTGSDPPCLTWMYSSAVDPIRDPSSGLVGPLVICKQGTLDENNKQKGINKEFYLLFSVFDENLSWYLNANIKYYLRMEETSVKKDDGFKESNRMHAINGLMFGNLPGLNVCEGDNVSWHLLGLGSEADVHGAVFQGNTLQMNGMRRDSANLFPHTFATALMQPDNTGIFEVYCQTSNHYQAGMRERYSVSKCGRRDPAPRYRGVRTYYILAEEVLWDYAPDRSWERERHNHSAESYADVFLSNKNGLLGSRYKKVVYREYTDGTFQTPKARTDGDKHLGILGPFLWAEVGDILNIVFKNNATRPYSIHAHGVLERKTGEPQAANPGDIVTYRWEVPERSGPGPNDSACVPWIYYSTVDPVKDMYSGLVGPLKVCRRGALQPDGMRKDAKREFALLFLVFDENQSWYLEENVKRYSKENHKEINLLDEKFVESNKMHAVNGRLYANLPGLTMVQGEWVNWYLLGMGQEIDVHTVHFHAETFIYKNGKSYRADVVDLFPGTFEMVEMLVGNPGTWLLHCHVSDHIHAGMEILFTVLPTPEPVLEDINYSTELPPEDESEKIVLFGAKLAQGQVEATVIGLATAGTVLFLVACALLGVVIYLERQKRLRRNRRSILDDGFKLMSKKNSGL